MKIDAELNSETSSAAGETGGPSHGKSPAASAPESEAAMPAAASTEGSPAGAGEDDQGKAVMTQVVEPSVEKGKSSSAAETGGDHQVGDTASATALPEAAAVDPLGEALAALDRRDYATAQRLFEALGRKDAAAAIENALAALDRKDYATAQGLFEALGETGAGGALASGSARRLRRPPSPRHRCWVRYRSGPAAKPNRNQ